MPGTRKLGRTTEHRNAMLRGMVTLLLEKGAIETTLSRAKELRCVADKMITLGKKLNVCIYYIVFLLRGQYGYICHFAHHQSLR